MLKSRMFEEDTRSSFKEYTQEGLFDKIFNSEARLLKDKELEARRKTMLSLFEEAVNVLAKSLGKNNLIVEYDPSNHMWEMLILGVKSAKSYMFNFVVLGDGVKDIPDNGVPYVVDFHDNDPSKGFYYQIGTPLSDHINQFVGGDFPGQSFDDYETKPGTEILHFGMPPDIALTLIKLDPNHKNVDEVSGSAVTLLLNESSDVSESVRSGLKTIDKDQAISSLNKRLYPVIQSHT